MKNGWIKLHRKIEEKGYYKDSHYIHLWIHLLLKANHKENEMLWNNELIKVKEGQFITGRKKLEKETGINQYKIERILKCFKSEQQIEQQTTTKFRLITIKNWKRHQEKYTTIHPTSAQQVHTNKNEKNDKNKEWKSFKKEEKEKYEENFYKEKGYFPLR